MLFLPVTRETANWKYEKDIQGLARLLPIVILRSVFYAGLRHRSSRDRGSGQFYEMLRWAAGQKRPSIRTSGAMPRGCEGNGAPRE